MELESNVKFKYYKVIVKFESEELDKAGNPKTTKSEYVVFGRDVQEVTQKTNDYLTGTILHYDIFSITESKIDAVVK